MGRQTDLLRKLDRERRMRGTNGLAPRMASPEPDVPVTAETQLKLDALKFVQKPVRDQLAILRQTRPQRDVGTLKIPPHLQSPDPTVVLTDGARIDPRLRERLARDPNTDYGVEQRGDVAGNILPAID